MMAFPSMLINAAQQAGMKVPDLSASDDYAKDDFPHFHVFCTAQLARRMQPGEHWENAKVVAAVPESEVRMITLDQLIERGLRYQS